MTQEPPATWDEVALLDLVTIRSGQVDPRAQAFRNLPLIAPDHISSATGQLLKRETAADQAAISGKYLVRPGDVIYSKIRPYLQKAYKCPFEALCSADMYALAPKSGVDPSFILHIVLGRDFTNFAVSVSARSGIPKINRQELSEYRFAVPPPAEQREIGCALDDADALVAALGRLIAKKQAIKEGMAQQLLTGRTRLSGFDAGWSEIRLGDIGSTYGGLTSKSKADFGSGSARFVTFLDVINSVRIRGEALEPVVVHPSERQNSVAMGDVLFNGSSETPDEVAFGAAVDFEPSPGTYLNSFCFGYRIARTDLLDPIYLAYMVRSGVGRRLVYALAQGATRYNISKRRFLELTPALPSLDEQTAIKTVLADADAEIDALKHRFEKARAIKEGMAQQLLTGNTRLPALEAVA